MSTPSRLTLRCPRRPTPAPKCGLRCVRTRVGLCSVRRQQGCRTCRSSHLGSGTRTHTHCGRASRERPPDLHASHDFAALSCVSRARQLGLSPPRVRGSACSRAIHVRVRLRRAEAEALGHARERSKHYCRADHRLCVPTAKCCRHARVVRAGPLDRATVLHRSEAEHQERGRGVPLRPPAAPSRPRFGHEREQPHPTRGRPHSHRATLPVQTNRPTTRLPRAVLLHEAPTHAHEGPTLPPMWDPPALRAPRCWLRSRS